MATSNWLLGVPDTSGDIFLANVNGVFQALATCSISSSEPPVKSAGMLWFDVNEGRLKQRNQNNSVWVPIFAIRNNQCIPLYNGQEVSNIVAVQPKGDGYLRCKNGVFILESIDSPDVPMFGVNRSGIVPGVTTEQSNSGYILKSNGAWDPPGSRRLGSVSFSGAKDYSIAGFSAAQAYIVSLQCRLSGGQSLMLQIGSGGSPTQQGYTSKASRVSPIDIYGDQNNTNINSDRGFVVFRPYAESGANPATWVFNCSLLNPTGNMWTFTGVGSTGKGGVQGSIDNCYGYVSLPGQLNYIRAISSGSPVGSFNNQNAIDSGYLSIFA